MENAKIYVLLHSFCFFLIWGHFPSTGPPGLVFGGVIYRRVFSVTSTAGDLYMEGLISWISVLLFSIWLRVWPNFLRLGVDRGWGTLHDVYLKVAEVSCYICQLKTCSYRLYGQWKFQNKFWTKEFWDKIKLKFVFLKISKTVCYNLVKLVSKRWGLVIVSCVQIH